MSDGTLTQAEIDTLLDEQIERQGCGSIRVGDGQVFVFTRAMLERLLAAAIENGGLATVFVKAGPSA